MSEYVLSTAKLESATYASTMYTFFGMEMLKDGHFMVMLDGRHRRRSFETWSGKNGVE